jgi:hypothetical protein
MLHQIRKSSVESIDFATSFTLLHSNKRAMANLFVVAVPPSSLMGGRLQALKGIINQIE